MVTTNMEALEDIVTEDKAELLSCSLQHQCYDGRDVASVYFTHEQWEAQIGKKVSLVKGAKRLLKAAKQGVNRAGTEWDKEETAWQEEEERNFMCSCRAHECENEELYVTVLGRLVTIAAMTLEMYWQQFYCRTSLRKADSACMCNPQELAQWAQ